jgi:HD domain
MKSIAGVIVPDTPLISRAIEFARLQSEPYLFNHVMRSWLFSVSIAEQRKVAHDAEVLAVATLLHDLGLAKAFAGPLRFEVEGANAARKFAQDEGVDRARAQLIWDGVALNSTPSLGLYKEIEVSLCTSGIGLDWGGWGYESLPASQIAEIVDAFPRLEMKQRFARDVCRVVETRPATTYDNFARDFGERFVPGYKSPSTVDLLMKSPFRE